MVELHVQIQICHNTRDWYICESGSPKSSFIIISSSCNVKRRSSLSSAWIVLTDTAVTTFGWPVRDSSRTLRRPSQNSQHHFLIIYMLMMSLPCTLVNCLWIWTALIFFAVKNCITVRVTHADTHAMGSSMFVVLLTLYIWMERPTKNSVLPQSQTEYFPQFSQHSDS